MSSMSAPVNRVIAAVARMDRQVSDRIASGETTTEAAERCSRSLDMDIGEYCKFQELKSGMMGDMLTTDEAQTIYAYLGETPDHFNAQPVHVKAVLTKLFAELLGHRLQVA